MPTSTFDVERAWTARMSDPSRAWAQVRTATDARASVVRAYLHWRDGRYEDALRDLDAAQDALDAEDDALWRARAANVRGVIMLHVGQAAQALRLFEEQLVLARRANDAEMIGLAHNDIGVQLVWDDPERALLRFRMAFDVYRDAPDEQAAGLGLSAFNLSVAYRELGDAASSEAMLSLAEAKVEEARAWPYWVGIVSQRALRLADSGDGPAARAVFEEARARSSERPLPLESRRFLTFFEAKCEATAGDAARALDLLDTLGAWFETRRDMLDDFFETRATAFGRQGDAEGACAALRDALHAVRDRHRAEQQVQLKTLETLHRTHETRRLAELERLRAEAARREAALERMEKVELQRALQSNAILIQSLRESQLVSETLLGVSHLMQLDLEPLDLARHALALVTRVVDVDWCALVRLEGGVSSVESVCASGDGEAFVHAVLPGVAGDLVGRAPWHEEPLFTSAYEREADAQAALVSAGVRGLARLFVGEAGDASYVLLLGRHHADERWSERERRVLGATARSLRVALDVYERNRRAREASLTDALTGLENRRAFEAHVQEATRGAAFSVAMLDLDGLKQVNDARGHAAGDALLRVFASTLKANATASTRAARLGGDEFALLIEHDALANDDTIFADVLEVVDAAIAAARTAGFSEAGCSFGVARWPNDGETPADVVANADARLYHDKMARRAAALSSRRGLEGTSDTVRFGDVVFTPSERSLRGSLGAAKLSPTEAAVLRTLAARAPRVVPRADLAAACGVTSGEASNTLDVHVSNVRRKLAAVTPHAGVRAVRGQGFSLQWVDARERPAGDERPGA